MDKVKLTLGTRMKVKCNFFKFIVEISLLVIEKLVSMFLSKYEFPIKFIGPIAFFPHSSYTSSSTQNSITVIRKG